MAKKYLDAIFAIKDIALTIRLELASLQVEINFNVIMDVMIVLGIQYLIIKFVINVP